MAERQFPEDIFECDGQPFGASFAMFDSTSIERATHMQQGIQKLRKSRRPTDKAVVKRINMMFEANDATAMNQELKIDRQSRATHDVVGWLARASVRDVVFFGAWNAQRHAELESQLHDDQELLQETTLAHLGKLTIAACFPKQAEQQFKRAFAHYSALHLMDSFESGTSSSNGYCTANVIALANLYDHPKNSGSTIPSLERTAFHEYLHGTAHNGNQGFFNGLTEISEEPRYRLLEEAFVSHFSQAAYDKGELDVTTFVQNDRKVDATAPYELERELLGLFVGSNDSNLELLAAAYFEAEDSRTRRALEKRLKNYFNTMLPAYRGYAWEALSAEYESHYVARTHIDWLDDVLNKIYKKMGYDIERDTPAARNNNMTAFLEYAFSRDS